VKAVPMPMKANPEHLEILKQGVLVWNEWRDKNKGITPNLRSADLRGYNLQKAHLYKTLLDDVTFSGSDLSGASFADSHLVGCDLSFSNLSNSNLMGADLLEANISGANLCGAVLCKARLHDADLKMADLRGCVLSGMVATEFMERNRDLPAEMWWIFNMRQSADLRGADLRKSNLDEVDLRTTNLHGIARKGLYDLEEAPEHPTSANFSEASLVRANLFGENLQNMDFRKANLSGANLSNTDLSGADFREADLTNASLQRSILVETDFRQANLTGSFIYGISAWNLKLSDAKQDNLVITDYDQPEITVDNIEVGQFIYLLLHNEKIRDIIDTVGKKGVLLLGRFSGGRLAILERLRAELRERDFIPMVFNFDRPEKSDLTETVMTLAGLCRFIIADITSPRSTPLELHATVPEYMIPFVPIIEDGEEPFAMFRDLWVKHSTWVLDPIAYGSVEELVQGLDEEIIKPALARFDELLVKKAKTLRVRRIGRD
jgi:uncharacterized protein YjbI with pentapeptide repeats